jgi:hypothetical protein
MTVFDGFLISVHRLAIDAVSVSPNAMRIVLVQRARSKVWSVTIRIPIPQRPTRTTRLFPK